MKKIFTVLILIIVAFGIFIFYKSTNSMDQNQNITNTAKLSKIELSSSFGAFLDTLQKNLSNDDFLLKVNKSYGSDFDVALYREFMTNVFTYGSNKKPFPNKIVCDESEQSCVVRFLMPNQLTQKYMYEEDMWYQVDPPGALRDDGTILK